MNIREAKDLVEVMANGAYHALTYELSEGRFSGIRQECVIYIDSRQRHSASSWAAAIEMMENEIEGVKTEIESIEEI